MTIAMFKNENYLEIFIILDTNYYLLLEMIKILALMLILHNYCLQFINAKYLPVLILIKEVKQ